MATPQASDIIALYRPRAGLPGATFTELSAAISAASAIPVEDEGSVVVAAPTALNFIGAGVTAVDNGGVADITIPGAAAIALNDLTDVTLAAEATGEILFKSAGNWLNTNAIVVVPTAGVTLKFNGGNRLSVNNAGALLLRAANDDVRFEIQSESNADAVFLLTNNLVGGARLFLNPTGGVASIQQTDASGNPQDTWLLFTRDGAVEGRHNNIAVFRSALVASGGMEVNNTVTGSGFERVLTTGDISAATVETLSWKTSVRVATTVDGTLATAYENGDTIDGVVLATGNRILLKNQTAGAENGIYTVNASGAPTRATDFDADAEVNGGAAIVVSEGTANADNMYLLTTNDPITVGTTALVFTEFGAGGAFLTDEKFKAADTSRGATTRLADPDLAFTGVATGRYILKGYLILKCASSTPDFDYDFIATGGLVATGILKFHVNASEAGAIEGGASSPFTQPDGIAIIANQDTFVQINMIFEVTTTGDLAFGWGQSSADAGNPTTVAAGSMMNIRRIGA